MTQNVKTEELVQRAQGIWGESIVKQACQLIALNKVPCCERTTALSAWSRSLPHTEAKR